jgi:hypothetical protein
VKNLKTYLKRVYLFVFIILLTNSCNNTTKKTTIEFQKNTGVAKILKHTYPDKIFRVDDSVLIWKDGTIMPIYDSIENKTYHQILNNPDIEDMFLFQYKKGTIQENPPINIDPGRIRNQQFFKKMYGSTPEEVMKNLVTIDWLPKTTDKKIQVTTINNVDEKLTLISKELDRLPDSKKKYVINIGGTYNWRKIAGTNRLSPHSFGIAIDINVDYSCYWKWDIESTGKMDYRNNIPWCVISIFEKHGFIWGGKWYHYDTMHFEYRPELLANNKRFH